MSGTRIRLKHLMTAVALLSLTCVNGQPEKWFFVIVEPLQVNPKQVRAESRTLEECSALATAYVEERYQPKKGFRSDTDIFAECRLNCRTPFYGVNCERDVVIPVYCTDPLSGYGCEL
jgi:hypothetical protein